MGLFYYAMEYIDGINLAQLVDLDGPQPAARVVHILQQVCYSLQEAHQQGLLHRDIKPQNIMLCRRGLEYDFAKVLDFGLVKAPPYIQNQELTAPLQIIGTPGYMAPERLHSPTEIGVASDIFSLGAVVYYLLSGYPAYYFQTKVGGLIQVTQKTPLPLEQLLKNEVPKDLVGLVMSCLAFDASERPKSIDQVLATLHAIHLPTTWSGESAKQWWEGFRSREFSLSPILSKEEHVNKASCDLIRYYIIALLIG